MHASEPLTRVEEEQILSDIDGAVPAVYDYLLHRCGGRVLAEDLTSDTVLAANNDDDHTAAHRDVR